MNAINIKKIESDQQTNEDSPARNKRISSLISLYIALNLFGYQLITTVLWRIAETNSRIITTPYRAFMLCFTVLITLLSFRINTPPQKMNISYICFWCFICIYSLKVLFDLLIAPEKADLFYETAWNYELYIIIPSFAALTRIIDKIDFEEVSKYVIFVLLICILFGFISARSIYLKETEARVNLGENLILNTITLGHLGTSGVLMFFVEWPSSLTFKNRFLFFIFKMTILILSIYLIIYAAARGPIMALVITMVLYQLTAKKESSGVFFLSIIVLFFSLLFYETIINYLDTVSPVVKSRIIDTIENGDEERRYLINRAIAIFREHPLGGGYFMIPNIGYSHNIYVDCLMTWGIFGLAFFLSISLKSIINALDMTRNPNKKCCIIPLLFLQNLIAANSSGTLYLNFPLILLFAIVLYYDSKKNSFFNKEPKKI